MILSRRNAESRRDINSFMLNIQLSGDANADHVEPGFTTSMPESMMKMNCGFVEPFLGRTAVFERGWIYGQLCCTRRAMLVSLAIWND